MMQNIHDSEIFGQKRQKTSETSSPNDVKKNNSTLDRRRKQFRVC